MPQFLQDLFLDNLPFFTNDEDCFLRIWYQRIVLPCRLSLPRYKR